MKGFKLDQRGDIAIENGNFSYVEDIDLTAQTIKTILETNKGEWFHNINEGIDFTFILGKNVTEDMARVQIQNGVRQVDSTLYVDEFHYYYDPTNRKSIVKFSVKDEENRTIISENAWE